MAYPGGKSGPGVYQRIISLMPPHRVYIEPFLGAGAVFRLKRPAEINIGVELDPEVLRGWALPPAAGAGESDGTAGPAELAAAAAGAESAGARRRRSAGSAAVAMRSRWQLFQGDGIEFLRRYRFQGDELVYCDPPYLMETRSSGPRYACEMSDGAHGDLLGVVRCLPCMVIVSGYWSELYADMLAAWRHETFESMTRGGMATEHLWLNFPAAVELHDYAYLGENRRQREQLKRQKARWLARLERLPELQRGALLSAIQEYSAAGPRSGAVENAGAAGEHSGGV